MEQDECLFTVKAPMHVIGFRLFDGKAVGLKPEQYQDYERLKEQALLNWMNGSIKMNQNYQKRIFNYLEDDSK